MRNRGAPPLPRSSATGAKRKNIKFSAEAMRMAEELMQRQHRQFTNLMEWLITQEHRRTIGRSNHDEK